MNLKNELAYISNIVYFRWSIYKYYLCLASKWALYNAFVK